MKKVISLFTAIVMLFASVVTTIPAAASSDLSSQEYELQVKAENSLGSLLADALLDESESDENKDGFTGYCIGGAEVSGNTVTIDYCAIEDCTIIAALYDDSGENMLMSGNAEVSASERQTTVTISGTMPDYFLLKVYPVDETTLRPLGPEYVNSDHTKAFQEAWAKTTNDFPEELVLNIDDNSDTNFFVHNEEVERVDYVEGVNIVASADFDNNVYVIENADSTFTSLKPGDKLSYIYGDNQIILTLVDSIDINGTTVTVRGAEAHLDDFFDHFQINCESECADVEVVEGTEGDGVTYLGRYGDLQNSTYTLSEDNEVTVSSMMLAGGYSSDPEEYFKTPIAPGSLTFEAEIDKGSFEFTLDLGGDFRIMYDYQIENGKKVDEIWDVRLEVTYDMAVKIGVECKVDEEIKLAEFVLFSFYGINLEVIPKIPYEISGAASVEFRFVGGRVGFQDMYLGEMGGGNHVQCPLNMDPDFAIDVDLEVTIKIGMEFDMAVCFICSDIAKLALSIGAEFVIEASYSGTVFSLAPDELNPPVKHDCGNDCISISAKWGPTVKFTATLFDLNDLSLEYELPIMGEDYYIPVADAYISLKYADAGFGECPHKSYRVDLFLNNSDPENSVVNGASITCEGETKNISSGNHAVFYLHSGMHRFDISVPELESTEEYYVYVDDSPTRCEAFIQYPAKTYTLEFTYPDGSAAAGESVYISNSYAGITDNNGRLDTELCVGKTYSFVTLMSGKGYSDPGKIRIPDINFTGNLQITVYRDGSERPADVQEIEKPWSAIVMVDDVYGEPVSGAELTIDGLGSFTTNKLGVAHIDVPDNNTYYGTAAKTGHLNTRFAIEAGIETVYVRLVKKANDPSDFEYTISNDEVTVTGYKGGSPCAVIPSEIEGCPVTALGSFTCSTVLEELVMPNSVTTIATSGFTSCKDLKKVLFSDSITSIPNYAFKDLTELKYIVFPKNLVSIGTSAFGGCTGIKSLNLPEGLTGLGAYAFQYCTQLESVYIPSTLTNVETGGWYWALHGPFYNCSSLRNVTFGTGITGIYGPLFSYSGLEKIVIPDSVTYIDFGAFKGCRALKTVDLPENIKTICRQAFGYCSSLTDIDFPENLEVIGPEAFINCSSLERAELPEGLKTLYHSAFLNCSVLKSVHIPSTLTVEIYDGASTRPSPGPFKGCSMLQDVSFENGITVIPKYLFVSTDIESIVIPDSVTAIGMYAFASCSSLTSIYIPSTVESIESTAFSGSSNLTIYGEMNSYAETFASEKNITFVVGSNPETAAVNSAVVTYEMQSGEELRYTANFTDLDANRIYNFYVMKDRYAQQPFAADNLLYISQHTSDENGVISVTYYPTEVCEDCDIFVVRMRLYDISSANISVADLTYTGERQFADPVVTFDGVELEEGIDYNLKGDFSATEIGTYNMEIVGTGDYYHSTFTSYSILEPEISSIEVTTLPETTEYMLNEELDITGAELTVNYVNNTAKKLSITADMVTGFDSTSVGDKTLTVTYGGQTATFVITVKAVGEFDHALDYTDNIGLVFYMKLGEDILSDDSAEMVFSLNGKTVKVPVAEAAPATVNDDTVYAFTCPVSAAEMADDIQAQIVTNDYESDTFTYSILQYVSDRYTDFRDGEHESGELAEYNAIAAMLNYGAATQEYFGHNTETLANSCLDPSDINVSSIDAGTLSSNRYLITDIKHTKIFRGLVIALKDQVSIKLYFSKNGLSLDDFTVTTGGESIDPSRLSVTCDESDTILEISDIGAGDLGESFTVTIGDVTISNISVLSYAQQVLSTDIEELSDIATALVNYNNCVITAKQCKNAA